MSIGHGERVLEAGEPLTTAHAAMVLVHGRGATAEDIMTVATQLHVGGFAFMAPQAESNAWYPDKFTAPLQNNEPHLSAALDMLTRLVSYVEGTVPVERIVLLGFSQGACLTLEFAARHARRYGAVIGLSGGLIGPDDTPRDYPGSFDGTPVFLGCSDVDPHIPKERVVAASKVLERMGAAVTLRLYPGMGHLVSPEEIESVRELITKL